MRFTIKDVMDIDVMSTAKVQTATNKLSERTVESVSVIEIPVEDFVRKNEFVLTTALGCVEDVNIFMEFVQDVLHADAAALAIATGRHVHQIPQEVLELAEAEGFPIIEIPWEIRFSDITQSILGMLNNFQRNLVKRSQELQKQLLHLFLHGNSLMQAAEVISQEFRLPAVIVDEEGIIKGESHDALGLVEKWNQHKKESSHAYQESAFPDYNVPAKQKSKSWICVMDNSVIKLQIHTLNKIHGYLLLNLLPETSLEDVMTDREAFLFESILIALSLWFQRENVIYETELRLRDDFVWCLAKGEYDTWDLVLSRAKSLEYNVNLPYVCILGAAENFETLYKNKQTHNESYNQWLYTSTRHVEEQVIKAAEVILFKVMCTYQRDRLIIFLEVPQDQIHETVHLFLDRVDSQVQQVLPGLLMSWGIGENHAGVHTFHEGFNDARIALDTGTRQKGPGHRNTYANTGIYRALLSLSSSPEIQEITLSTLGKLIDYDQQRDMELVNTLVAYIRNQGNVSQTSRALNLHRQSLLYRLKKIENLTDRSLEDPDDLFLLNLSIKLWTSGLSVK